MVDRSAFSNFMEGLQRNSSAILVTGLSFLAILVILILLIVRRKKQAQNNQQQGVQLFDEKRPIRRRKPQRHQQTDVKLFNELDNSFSEGNLQTDNSKNQNRKDLQSTVQLFDEKIPRRKIIPKQQDKLQLFDEQPHNEEAYSEHPVTIGLSVPENKPQKTSDVPTTLELFPEDEQDETYTIGNAQHIGKRDEQQDAFGVSDIFNRDEVAEKGILAVLADGMGGLQNGAESSKCVVSLMLEAFTHMDFHEDIPEGLKTIVQDVNTHINNHFNLESSQIMTGSTVVASIIRENLLYWISVGDSRIYLFRDNKLSQLNREHNYGARLDENVQLGIISAAEAENDPNRAALTSYIGIDELTEMDRNIEPVRLQPGDRVMMCSDGLFSTLSEEEMARALAGNPQEAAQDMVNRVVQIDRKYQDNVTVVVLGFNIDQVQGI